MLLSTRSISRRIKRKDIIYRKRNKENKIKIDVKPTVASPLVNGYRNKAIVAFNQKYEYGLYEEHSQDIIPYKHCLLHEDIMDEILQYIQSYLRSIVFLFMIVKDIKDY